MNHIQVPPDYSVFALYFFGFFLDFCDSLEITTNNNLFTHTSNHLKASTYMQESKRHVRADLMNMYSSLYNLFYTRDMTIIQLWEKKKTRRT